MILSKLVALFVVVPIAELYILLEIGRRVGIYLTIGIVIVTGVTGAYLVKYQGFYVLYKIKSQMNEGIVPTDSLFEGLIILVGGIFLITPGIMTDIIGFLLVIPQSRSIVFGYLKKWLMLKMREHDIYFWRNHFE